MKIAIVLFLCGISAYGYAQESFGGVPLLFQKEAERQTTNGIDFDVQIPRKTVAWVDNEREQQQADSIATKYGFSRNKFYGKTIPVNIDFKAEASIENLGDTGKLYLLELVSPSAYALQVYFDAFKIPKGAKMFVYDGGKKSFLGSFTHKNNFIDNTFATLPISDNSLIIEYYEPNHVEFEAELHIKDLVHTFSRHGPFSPEGSQSCEINVSCELGWGWDREIRSVALILGQTWQNGIWGYWGHCTGAMINNTAQDGRPYMLTARHCLDDAPIEIMNTANWIFLFDYQTEQCSDNGTDISGSVTPPQAKSIYGANILSSDQWNSPTTDYLLLELNATPTTLSSYHVVYAGWDVSEDNATKSKYTVGIHHPSGDVKKISKDTGSPISVDAPSMDGNPPSGAQDTHWKVTWNYGITEWGSSGSPLFNDNHKIIGQLHGGSSFCDTPDAPDYYGKFSRSYAEGGLALWLDPNNTFATSIGAYNPSMLREHCYNGVKDGDESDIDCGGSCMPCSAKAETCNNGRKDEGETGIDCGGPCKPCGSFEQCNNCVQDGDETRIDCGGSCPPCNSSCTHAQITYTNSNIPIRTNASNYIEATNVVIPANKEVSFNAVNRIVLKPGFRAQSGSNFFAQIIASCQCKEPCEIWAPNIFTPNGDGKNDWLCYIARGYNRFKVWIYSMWGRLIYESSGVIEDNYYAFLWDGTNMPSNGTCSVVAEFYSDCSGVSVSDTRLINLIRSVQSPVIVEEDNVQQNMEDYKESNGIDLEDISSITIYPNPNNGNFIISSPQNIDSYIDIQIIDQVGNTILNDCVYNHAEITIPNAQQGIYFVLIGQENQISSHKIIVQ